MNWRTCAECADINVMRPDTRQSGSLHDLPVCPEILKARCMRLEQVRKLKRNDRRKMEGGAEGTLMWHRTIDECLSESSAQGH